MLGQLLYVGVVGGGGSGAGGNGGYQEPIKTMWEIVQLDGNIVGAALAFSPSTGSNSASAGVTGNEFVLTGEYQAFQLEWLRETDQDKGLEIFIGGTSDGIGFNSGGGCIYAQDLPGFAANTNEIFTQEVSFKAKPGAFVQILITRRQ